MFQIVMPLIVSVGTLDLPNIWKYITKQKRKANKLLLGIGTVKESYFYITLDVIMQCLVQRLNFVVFNWKIMIKIKS